MPLTGFTLLLPECNIRFIHRQCKMTVHLRMIILYCFIFQDNDYYLVPCMLKEPPLKPFLNAESQFISTPNLCLVLENAAFPSAIFNRLLVGCIARWPIAESGGKIQIYCGCGQFDVDNQQSHRLTLAFHDNVVSLRITKFSKTKHPDKSICNDVYTSVKQILDRISKCLSLTIKPKEYVQCPGDTTDVVSCKHSIERLKSCDEFPCHKHTTVTILHSCDLLKYWFEDSYHVSTTETLKYFLFIKGS